MKAKVSLVVTLLLLLSGSATAATFVVPTDDELVLKADAIATGTVEGSFVQEVGGTIETVVEVRIDRGFKGSVKKDELVRVVTLGGVIGDRGVLVPGEARYAAGERVLVFLDRDEKGRWRTTDLTLGRFLFVQSTRGERLLVRDMENAFGWDHAGNAHREKVRRESGFLQFIEARSKNRPAPIDYMIEASAVTFAPQEDGLTASANATSYPASTYTDFVNNQPIRWPSMANGIPFYKRSDQNISGAADGGVSVIQGGLAAWTNEPSSNINLSYIGQIAKASQNHDATNVVEFNDPQGRVSGSWTGSGTVGICFLSFAGEHSFLGQAWLNITDADVVFQDGYPATNASFSSAMTHELGHGIGWRHSNQNHATGGTCNSAVEECTSAAIMNSSVSANYGYNLQSWDRNAAQSVYPGAATCTAPAMTAQPTSRTITAGQSTTLSVTATGTSLAYQWYVGASGNTASPIAGATGPSVTVAPGGTTSYWVRVSNACGAVNSSTATVTVTAACTAPSITSQPTSRTITSGTSTTLSVGAGGTAPLSYQWYVGTSGNTASPISGQTSSSLTVSPASTTSYWVRVSNACGSANSATATVTVSAPPPPPPSSDGPRADFDGDLRSELMLRNSANQLAMWDFTGRTITNSANFATVSSSSWRIEGFGDFNGDGRYDILWRAVGGTGVAMWLLNGRSIISQPLVGNLPSASWNFETFGDFNGDGRTDAIALNPTTGQVAMWEFNGTTIVNNSVITTLGNLSWRIQGSGDFDGDGSAEILWRNVSTQQMAMWDISGRTLTNGGVFGTAPGTSWEVRGVGDFDADGRDDILWQNTSTLDVNVWDMSGRTFVSRFVTRVGSSAWRVDATGDYDGDGGDEVMWFNTSTRQVAMWELSSTHTLVNGGIVGTVPGDYRIQPPFNPVR
jgi:hypothetical protein